MGNSQHKRGLGGEEEKKGVMKTISGLRRKGMDIQTSIKMGAEGGRRGSVKSPKKLRRRGEL